MQRLPHYNVLCYINDLQLEHLNNSPGKSTNNLVLGYKVSFDWLF